MSNQPKDSTHQNRKILFIVLPIILLVGICAAIYGVIRINQDPTLVTGKVIDDDVLLEEFYAIPSDINSIELIEINYDGYNSYINVDSTGLIVYSTLNNSEDDEYTESEIKTDTSEIMQYAFDNIVPYLGNDSSIDDETWSVTVYSSDGISYIGGTGDEPEWLSQLISKVSAAAGI